MKKTVLFFAAIFIYSGCASLPPALPVKEKEAAPSEERRYLRYIVQKGDTLWKISRMAYNDSEKWRRILDANRDGIKDVRQLEAGQIIIIPID